MDGMDSFIYALVLAPAMRELLPKSGIAATPANVASYGAILFALGVSVLAALYPAARAARIDPVRALRHD